MATAAVSNTFTNGSNADAVEVNSNFTSLVNFLNTEVITRDAAIAFTAIPSGPATNPTLDNQFTRKYYVDNLEPAGVISAYGGATAPTGYVICDGTAISRTNPSYVRLFAAIATRYGVGDNSTTFNVPNLVGKFPYGHATNATVATAGAATVTLTTANLAVHVHNISAYTHTAPTVTQPVLSNHADHNHALYLIATSAAGAHSHEVGGEADIVSGSGFAGVREYSGASTTYTTSTAAAHTHTVTGNSLDASLSAHSFSTAVAVAATATHGAKDTDSTGSATPFSILPPYQSVMYIIKL